MVQKVENDDLIISLSILPCFKLKLYCLFCRIQKKFEKFFKQFSNFFYTYSYNRAMSIPFVENADAHDSCC